MNEKEKVSYDVFRTFLYNIDVELQKQLEDEKRKLLEQYFCRIEEYFQGHTISDS